MRKTWNINLIGKKQISIAKSKIGFPKGRKCNQIRDSTRINCVGHKKAEN